MRGSLAHRIGLGIALAIVTGSTVRAQPGTDEQLAAQYFQQGDYERALLYYERLYEQQPTPFYYEQLYKSYVALKRYEPAEKLVKAQARRQDDPRYAVDLGSLYRLMGDDDKADQQFEKALKQLTPDGNRVRLLANAFIRVNELDLALETYERGQRMVRDGSNFHYEIASLYAAKGDIPGMVREYMNVLEANEGYIQAVQNGLSRYIDFEVRDERSELLRTELLRHIQRDPDKVIFQDLLIWMYIQQKDLTSAMVQSKAMDKRFNEGGARLMELAGIALANNDFVTATKCYEYVTALERKDANYLQARMGLVRTLHQQVTAQAEPVPGDLQRLDLLYASTLDELGRSNTTVQLTRDWAQLKAYYLNDHAAAVALLEAAIAMPTIDAKTQGQLKLDLGDVHVLDNDIWEASLLYSQVDLDFKYDVLGNEARLRNARVSFYAGDLLWAQGQLDVLKASTSKLIANDAMELSLLISDNFGVDSNTVPLGYFGRAQLLTFQHRYAEALSTLDSLDREFPMHSLGDNVLYERYRIAYARRQYTEAATYLEKILELYPLEILVDNALFDLGMLYEEKLDDPEKAKGYFEKLLFEQSGSIFVPEARDHFRRLRGDHDELITPEQKFLNGEAP